MEEFSFLLKLLVDSIDTFIGYLEELLNDLPEEIAFGQFIKDLHIYIRVQINKFFILRRKEEGYEAITVLPIFGRKGVYIPVNKIRAKQLEDTWLDQEDWDTDIEEEKFVLTPKKVVNSNTPKVKTPRLNLRKSKKFDLRQAFRTIYEE